MTRFFREKRGEDPDTHDTREPESEGLVLPHALPELSSASNRPVPHRELINASTTEETNGENHDGLLKGIKHHDHEPTQTLETSATKRDREDGADETALTRRQLDPRHAQPAVERQPEPQPEQVIAQQPNRRFERQSEQPSKRSSDHDPEWSHDVISTRAPERIVKVAPIALMRINEPHEVASSPICDAPRGPHSSPRMCYAPDSMTRRMYAPSTQAQVGSLQEAPQSLKSPSPALEDEITRKNLVLEHDGVVYTYPECVKGVPLVKIDESHPYWEPSWKNVISIIEPQRVEWLNKYQVATEASREQGKSRSSSDSIKQQLDRRTKILEFHALGPVSPYQLLGKKFTNCSITSVKALFRLSKTIAELKKYNLDISPVEWMRQRLHEIMQDQPTSFDLARTIQGF
ncbi:unnamed protein product, partial [Fusarium langsethiae]